MTNKPRMYSQLEWEAQRLEITRMYVAENMPLKEMMESMKTQYSFHANQRQYKTRIAQWGLEKKVKHNEMVAIVHLDRQRRMQGKITSFRVRKRAVDPRKIQRFLRENQILDTDSLSNLSTPSVISYTTSKQISPTNATERVFDISASNENTPGRPSNLNDNISLKASSFKASASCSEISLSCGNEQSHVSQSRYALSQHSSPRPFTEYPPKLQSTTGDTSLMYDLFDFSAAAKSTIRSSNRPLQTAVVKRSLPTRWQTPSESREIAIDSESVDEVLETLESLVELAGRVEDQGKYEWSRVLLQRVVRLHHRRLGNSHPTTLDAIQALTRILRAQGRYSEAEKLLSGALEAFRETRGDSHADTLDCIGLLALVMMNQGRLSEAEAQARMALETRLTFSNINDLGVAQSKNILGTVLASAGRHQEAEKLHREVLNARTKILGREHESTVKAMDSHAEALCGQGKYDLMMSEYLKMLEIQTRTIGRQHPQTLSTLHNIAMAHGEQGLYQESEAKYREVIDLKSLILGLEHPHTLASMHNLAWILGQQKRYSESENLSKRILQLKERTLGLEHPSTLFTQANLIPVLESLGEDDEAEKLARATLASRAKVLGHEHPNTLASRVRLARFLQDKGDYTEAAELFCQVLAIRQRVLGDQHIATREVAKSLDLLTVYMNEEEESIRSDSEESSE